MVACRRAARAAAVGATRIAAISRYSGSRTRQLARARRARSPPCSSGRCAAAAGALELLLDGGVQVDDEAARSRAARGSPAVEHRAAAGGQHDAGGRVRSAITSRSRLRKPLLAFLLEDEGDVDAGARLDLVVAVDELHAERAGQALGRRRSCRSPSDRSGRRCGRELSCLAPRHYPQGATIRQRGPSPAETKAAARRRPSGWGRGLRAITRSWNPRAGSSASRRSAARACC